MTAGRARVLTTVAAAVAVLVVVVIGRVVLGLTARASSRRASHAHVAAVPLVGGGDAPPNSSTTSTRPGTESPPSPPSPPRQPRPPRPPRPPPRFHACHRPHATPHERLTQHTQAMMRRPLHLVHNDSARPPPDFYFRAVASAIGRPVRLIDRFEDVTHDSLVVAGAGVGTQQAAAVLSLVRERGLRNVGLFHADDERGTSPAQEDYAQWAYVLRSYYFRRMLERDDLQGRIAYVPTGYATSRGPFTAATLLPATARSVACNFLGGVFKGSPDSYRTASRNRMFNALTRLGNPCLVEVFDGFAEGRHPFDYTLVLRDSVFTLCPAGNSNETFRHFDAMESGSIPITLTGSEYVEAVGDDNAMVMIDDWSDLNAVLRYYRENPAQLLARQQAVMAFWRALQWRTRARAMEVVDASFARAHGDGA